MKKNCLLCEAVPNIPWQERTRGSDEIVWRYSENPIIGRNPQAGRIAYLPEGTAENSAVYIHAAMFAI